MQIESDFLTKSHEDWPISNLSVLQKYIGKSYTVSTWIQQNCIALQTKHSPLVGGILRWAIMDYFLEVACKAGELPGIDARWRAIQGDNGTAHVLELYGKNTVLMAHHLATPIEVPRKSYLRDKWRLDNEQLFPFDSLLAEENRKNGLADPGGLYGILLVHGGKEPDFAFLRAYHDSNNPSQHTPLYSDNIMSLPQEVEPMQTEEIDEVIPELKAHLDKINRPGA